MSIKRLVRACSPECTASQNRIMLLARNHNSGARIFRSHAWRYGKIVFQSAPELRAFVKGMHKRVPKPTQKRKLSGTRRCNATVASLNTKE